MGWKTRGAADECSDGYERQHGQQQWRDINMETLVVYMWDSRDVNSKDVGFQRWRFLDENDGIDTSQ